MDAAITEGVKITVLSQFRPDISNIANQNFFFNYRVQIENNNQMAIQLLTRDWYVFDSLNDPNYISGEGVVGEQPIIQPSESFTYISGCELHSEIGYMRGFYTFLNLETQKRFRVYIPLFKLIYPPRLN
jgi:ApaG protein